MNKEVIKLVCLSSACNGPLDLVAVAARFPFVRHDALFGGRICTAFMGATVWIYKSGKITVLGREIGQAKAARASAICRLKEGGYTTDIGHAVPWNILTQIEANACERLSLRKLACRIPNCRFERTQRAVLCELKHGIDEKAGHSLVQIYGSGKILIRGRHEGPLPQAIGNLVPAIEGARQA